MKDARTPRKKRNRAGFSVIEMLIVVSIMGILAGTLLGFNRSSQKSVALATEQSRLMGILGRARSLALQRYTAGSNSYTCGIRVKLSGGTVSLVAVVRPKDSVVKECDNLSSAVLTERAIESSTLEEGITVASSTQIYFSSPYLKTDLSAPLIIKLTAPGTTRTSQIEITPGGTIMPKIE